MTLSYRQRVLLLALLGCFGAGVIVVRLFTLQVVQHGQWEAKADAQIATWRPIHARRGRILDRDGFELAGDEAGFELAVCAAAWQGWLYECEICGYHIYFKREPGKDRRCPRCRAKRLHLIDRRDLRRVADLLEIHPAELRQRIESRIRQAVRAARKDLEDYPERLRAQRERMLWADHGWRRRRIARDVSYEVAREVELHPDRNPAFRIQTVHTRRAHGGPECTHIVGRVAQRLEPLEDPDGGVESVRIALGQTGIEKRYEETLAGSWGWVSVSRNPRTGETKEVARRPPVHGVDVRLTIRRQDQTRAMAALDGCTGAFVVLDADTGAVIAAASAPSYEADRYAEVLAEQKAFFEEHRYWRRHHPLKDAAFRDFHVPGSVMKPFTAIASLTAGVSTPETRVVCEHYFRNRRGDLIRGALKCDDTHGELDLHHALVRSCNIYFQTLVKQIMEKELFPHFAATGGRFGFGKPTGAEIEPAPFQDTFKFGSSWAEYVLCAIGQSDIELSTAQIARAYAGLATGSLPRVHLVAEVGGERRRPETERLGIPASVLQPIRAALVEVPRTGTARGYHLERWNVACKTGTAQRVMRERPRPRRSYNGWLAGWVPAQNGRPRIAFAMVVLDTHLHGAQACGPRVAEFLAGFFGEGRG